MFEIQAPQVHHSAFHDLDALLTRSDLKQYDIDPVGFDVGIFSETTRGIALIQFTPGYRIPKHYESMTEAVQSLQAGEVGLGRILNELDVEDTVRYLSVIDSVYSASLSYITEHDIHRQECLEAAGFSQQRVSVSDLIFYAKRNF